MAFGMVQVLNVRRSLGLAPRRWIDYVPENTANVRDHGMVCFTFAFSLNLTALAKHRKWPCPASSSLSVSLAFTGNGAITTHAGKADHLLNRNGTKGKDITHTMCNKRVATKKQMCKRCKVCTELNMHQKKIAVM